MHGTYHVVETIHGAMAVVPGRGPPTGALQRHHSLNHDITDLELPPEKQTSTHALDSIGTACAWSVAIICIAVVH